MPQTQTALRRFFPAMESGEYRKLFYAAGLSAVSLWALVTARCVVVQAECPKRHSASE